MCCYVALQHSSSIPSSSCVNHIIWCALCINYDGVASFKFMSHHFHHWQAKDDAKALLRDIRSVQYQQQRMHMPQRMPMPPPDDEDEDMTYMEGFVPHRMWHVVRLSGFCWLTPCMYAVWTTSEELKWSSTPDCNIDFLKILMMHTAHSRLFTEYTIGLHVQGHAQEGNNLYPWMYFRGFLRPRQP